MSSKFDRTPTRNSNFRSVLLLALLLLAVVALASAAILAGTALGSGPKSAHKIDPLVAITGASPYEPGCGIDIEGNKFGDNFDDAEVEVSIAVNPLNPSNMIATWMQDLYRGYPAAYTLDGGKTWNTVVVPGVSLCAGGDMELAADPWVSFGTDGTAYLSGFALDLADGEPVLPVPLRSRLSVNTSIDGGQTWSNPVEVAGGLLAVHDKPAVTAHPTRAGIAYVVWTREVTAFGPTADLYFASTSDGGQSWSPPGGRAILNPVPPGFLPHGSELLVLPDGTLVVLATLVPTAAGGDVLPHTIVATRSTDGGATWSPPVTVTTFNTRGPSFASITDPDSEAKINAPGAFFSADVAPNGTLYVTWREAVSDTEAEIRIAASRDGVNWTPPALVASSEAQMFLPILAVSGEGTIGVSYYDDRHDVLGDGQYSADVWFSSSSDGGLTWVESRVTPSSVDLLQAPYRRIPAEGHFVGDYHGLAGLDRGFAMAFALPRPLATTGASDVFFTHVKKEWAAASPR